MSRQDFPPRLHLLPAHQAQSLVILRRGPSKLFHVLAVDTRTHAVEAGSWFHGKLYPKRCDLSFDGQWLVYLAMGADGRTWNGVCAVPWLKTFAEGSNRDGTWYGGGVFTDKKTLALNYWQIDSGNQDLFRTEPLPARFGGEDLNVLYQRLERDGWRRAGDNWGEDQRLRDIPQYQVACVGDDGWLNQPHKRRPSLRMRYAGYLEHGYTFRFDSPDERLQAVLGDDTEWATWDSSDNLWLARAGFVEKYIFPGPNKQRPGGPAPSLAWRLDLNDMRPPE